MGDVKSGKGVQVITVQPDGYALDEVALREILMQDEVRDLPVVIVSVAGAYRGGKSFILDFFLRYLNATRETQLEGNWLGQEDKPLDGFHWRGGAERDTTGIHLWSKPILVTLEGSGEKVAVLLMDTQGTFDSKSTIGQNSAIFALSMLISSVQIYNLSGNIQEDNLQHLQLFTGYGALACERWGSGEKAFQKLIFLVRDWNFPYDHPYGFNGGETLLNSRLTPTPEQQSELREVRECIYSCFDQIKCFLMPHPGLRIVDREFDGRIEDIDNRFKSALLELVPSLFHPKHLTPKLINGQQVKAKDLLNYFKTYVDIFNSNEMPKAETIFRATAEACMQAAAREARELYDVRMRARAARRSVTHGTLAACHCDALRAAVTCFSEKKMMAAAEDIEWHRDQLINDLEARLPIYMSNNEAMVRKAVLNAKEAYDEAISSVCEDHTRLCLHPLDLEDLHAKACSSALTLFDSKREAPENAVDEDRAGLIETLKQRYDHLSSINEQNNNVAVLEARDLYVTRMKNQVDVIGVSSNTLREQHQIALGDAHTHFNKQRNRATDRDDLYVKQLIDAISTYFADLEKTNFNNNKLALQGAEYTYNNNITAAWGPPSYCFHPRALLDLHKKAAKAALEQFFSNTAASEGDVYKDKIHRIFRTRYNQLKAVNDTNNLQAVEHAVVVYKQGMNLYRLNTDVPITDPEQALIIMFNLMINNTIHQKAAVKAFNDRRCGENFDEDTYYERLQEEIENARKNYVEPVMALLSQINQTRG